MWLRDDAQTARQPGLHRVGWPGSNLQEGEGESVGNLSVDAAAFQFAVLIGAGEEGRHCGWV